MNTSNENNKILKEDFIILIASGFGRWWFTIPKNLL